MNLKIIILFLLISIGGCRKKNTAITYTDAGTLTGFDPRLCACCGGIFLESDDLKTYHIESLPGMSNEELSRLTFPKRIRYNKSFDRECGGIIYLNILSYKFD